MTDTELAQYLGIAGEPYEAKFMASVTPERRALYEAMKTIEEDVKLWQEGVAPRPTGAILCFPHDAKGNV